MILAFGAVLEKKKKEKSTKTRTHLDYFHNYLRLAELNISKTVLVCGIESMVNSDFEWDIYCVIVMMWWLLSQPV